MTYRLNLYSNAKLTSTELLESTLEQAKASACAHSTAAKRNERKS